MTRTVARSARVRPYAITGGRTRFGCPPLLETLVPVPEFDVAVHRALTAESRDIFVFCRAVRSIAEISAGLGIPLGVVRVLVSDLAEEGSVRIRPSAAVAGLSNKVLLERVLRGLQTIQQ